MILDMRMINKKKLKYLCFEKNLLTGNIDVKDKKNNKELGYIFYYDDWKSYTFMQTGVLEKKDIIFAWHCMQDLTKFLEKKNKEEKK